MSFSLLSVSELAERHASTGLIRLASGHDVPLTRRVRRLIDTPAFRRLAQISQLGLVQLVYPGATHTRFEHSLGVYRMALKFIEHMAGDERFLATIKPENVECFLLAALLHDVGHWPYCHAIEDMRLAELAGHEDLARKHVCSADLARAIEEDWSIDPAAVADTIAGQAATPAEQVLKSMLSGPIDVDKIDYLSRDSHHAGVPYGKNFDQARLVSSLQLNQPGTAIAVSDKGKTAAELMVFARYVMFSEVYWHHAVRSATAMLQRAVYLMRNQLDFGELFGTVDSDFSRHLFAACDASATQELLSGIFGPDRKLYKRVAQYSFAEKPEVYQLLARKPYTWLVEKAEQLAQHLSSEAGQSIAPHEIIIDAPPVKLEVQCNIDVYFAKADHYRPLAEVSPVVRALAEKQFDDFVKRVRVFVHPRLVPRLAQFDLDAAVSQVAGQY